jgi:hypothetical protein
MQKMKQVFKNIVGTVISASRDAKDFLKRAPSLNIYYIPSTVKASLIRSRSDVNGRKVSFGYFTYWPSPWVRIGN